ncbi:hypothetical protein J3E68DRAFT_411665 [Trichoderma sp. SZMC 28012]
MTLSHSPLCTTFAASLRLAKVEKQAVQDGRKSISYDIRLESMKSPKLSSMFVLACRRPLMSMSRYSSPKQPVWQPMGLPWKLTSPASLIYCRVASSMRHCTGLDVSTSVLLMEKWATSQVARLTFSLRKYPYCEATVQGCKTFLWYTGSKQGPPVGEERGDDTGLCVYPCTRWMRTQSWSPKGVPVNLYGSAMGTACARRFTSIQHAFPDAPFLYPVVSKGQERV